MGKKVLIVDDVAMHRARVHELLSAAGYDCLEARDGVVAVSMYETEQPDAVLMDIEMPRLDGMGALEAILQDDPDAKVAMLSVYGSKAATQLALESGAMDYVLKTDPGKRILECVRHMLGESTTSLITR